MKKLIVSFIITILLLPVICSANTQFNLSGSMLIFAPRIGGDAHASAVKSIAGGVCYRPEVVTGEMRRPGRIAFSADYYQMEISSVGVSYYPLTWEGIDFSIGARALMRGTPEALTLGGELRFGGEFAFGNQHGFFVLGGGYIPDDQQPIVFEIGLGVLTE